ncbi:hypothetical protein LCGC14_2263240 [marine sediment metagenome]|uniref:Uncharacterized protein n=2 Tax=marine sediment metagenome TaxID=412755 RepID=A0A0F9CZ96_9ZZZZ
MSDIGNIQNRNLGNLLKIFGSKQATDALKEMAKVKAGTWTDIKDTVSDLKVLSTGGGTGAIIDSFRDTIDLSLQAAFAPLTNEVNQLMTDWMTANITPILNDIATELSAFVSENSVGATVGGIAGQIASFFLPGGPILIAVGALIGAGVESGLVSLHEWNVNATAWLENLLLTADQKKENDRLARVEAARVALEATRERNRIRALLITPEELAELIEEQKAERLRRERERRVNPIGRRSIVF